ncbi:MAG: hypothetical protein JWL90_4128 [Chthoniobacteraceae bacterium]|nr:hypothetical protein [Chthoniobacteraceae bacterium]
MAAPIRIESPLEYQVFQRETLKSGTIELRALAAVDEIEYRLSGSSLPASWQLLKAGATTHRFETRIPVPAGGWYKLEVRAAKEEQRETDATIEHIGVGEIFIVAGQSNSANHGSEKQRVESGLVSSFHGSEWTLANDPQRGASGSGGSFIPAFGDAMALRFGVPIGVAAVGVGSSSVRQWLPGGSRMTNLPTVESNVRLVEPGIWESTGELFDQLIKPMTQLGAHGFRAVLWHQGESDAGQARAGYPADRQITGEQYRGFMEQLIRAASRQIGREIPWFVAQTTFHSVSDPADEEFRAAQKSLWGSVALEGPDTDSLTDGLRDGVHFNGDGLKAHGALWAQKVGSWLDQELAAASDQHSDWNGYKRADFVVEGRKALLVAPMSAAPGKPWIWRTEFFGHEPQADIALLGHGFHVAYIDLQNMYGAPVSLDLMDKFYAELTGRRGLAPKPVLEGFSRGGLFAYNWAARHPDQVGAIYADAPVCDFKSWPGGKGAGQRSPGDWERLKGVYQFGTEEEALAYRFNPIDNLAPLARAHIPLLHVVGDADKTVPIEENTLLIKERYGKLGGEIEVISKPGVDHHPHSLKDPEPIVRFILRHTPR